MINAVIVSENQILTPGSAILKLIKQITLTGSGNMRT